MFCETRFEFILKHEKIINDVSNPNDKKYPIFCQKSNHGIKFVTLRPGALRCRTAKWIGQRLVVNDFIRIFKRKSV